MFSASLDARTRDFSAAAEQRFGRERLCKRFVRAEGERTRAVFSARRRAHDDIRIPRERQSGQTFQHGEAVHLAQNEREQQKIKPFAGKRLQKRAAAAGCADGKAVFFQQRRGVFAALRVAIRHEGVSSFFHNDPEIRRKRRFSCKTETGCGESFPGCSQKTHLSCRIFFFQIRLNRQIKSENTTCIFNSVWYTINIKDGQK